jgi:flagellar motor switch protein FliM
MLQVAGPNEVIILLVFDLKVGDIRGMLNLCIPAAVIEATGSSFMQGWQRTHRDPTEVEQRWLHSNLGRVPLDVTTTIETTMRARELVKLERGDVLSLGVPVQAPVAVRVGRAVKFAGRLTTANGHAALRVDRTATQGDLATAEGI